MEQSLHLAWISYHKEVVMDEVKKNRLGERESGRYQTVVKIGMLHPFTSKLHLHFLTTLKLHKSTTN
jgi:hypothetical protein